MPGATQNSVFDFECKDLQGKPIALNQFTGQPLLIVNTASLCGFSTQFKGLEETWLRFKERGLVVIAVPSNDFGKQEPGNSAEIATMCSKKFGISFPLLAKTHVASPDADPLFKWLAKEGGYFSRPRWNFYKYIVSRNGHLQNWFSFLATPETKRFQRAIAKAVG